MKKLLGVFLILAALFATAHAYAEVISVELGLFDEGAIIARNEAEFTLTSPDGTEVSAAKAIIDWDTQKVLLNFEVENYVQNGIYSFTALSGIGHLDYVNTHYGIGDGVPLNTADAMHFRMALAPIYIPKTGVRADTITFRFHLHRGENVIKTGMNTFNLLDSEGNVLQSKSVSINNLTTVANITFEVPQYYTGKKFKLALTEGSIIGIKYYDTEYTYNYPIEIETFAGRDENGATVIGNVFDFNVIPYIIPMKRYEPVVVEEVVEPEATVEAEPVVEPEPEVAPEPQPEPVRDSYEVSVERAMNESGVDSRTPYLIWISKKNFTVHVLEGTQGNWKFVKSFPCSIGKDSTPTITGVFEYYAYQPRWSYDKYYCGPIMRFAAKGYAMHSTLIRYDGTPYDARLGMKISHGCVRIEPTNIQWLADYMPLNTRVYITEWCV